METVTFEAKRRVQTVQDEQNDQRPAASGNLAVELVDAPAKVLIAGADSAPVMWHNRTQRRILPPAMKIVVRKAVLLHKAAASSCLSRNPYMRPFTAFVLSSVSIAVFECFVCFRAKASLGEETPEKTG